tara:strand:- start:163 stop:876 length:714 start_codon:yes stop_codon:yes gene_type:complete
MSIYKRHHILFLLVCSILIAQNQFDDEKLIYDVYFGRIYAGSAYISIQNEVLDSAEVYLMQAAFQTNSFFNRFYKINNIMNIWMNKDDLTFLKVENNINEKNYKKKFTSIANYKDSLITFKKKRIKINSKTYNPFSIVYLLRNLDLKLGETLPLTSFSNGKIKNFNIQFNKEEFISVPYGDFNCIKTIPISSNNKELFRNNGQMRIWFTKDSLKIPIKIEQKLRFGTILLKLNKIKH